MIDNNTRFGALCSASKTYFVFLDPGGDLKVTNAWFTGHRLFIKSWASFFRLAREYNYTGDISLPVGWLEGTPIQKNASEAKPAAKPDDDDNNDDGDDDDDDDDGKDGKGRGRGRKRGWQWGGWRAGVTRDEEKKNRKGSKNESKKKHSKDKKKRDVEKPKERAEQPPPRERAESPDSRLPSCYEPFDFENDFVPFVDFAQLKVGVCLGSGRNGDVFQSTLSGTPIAVKQFDITKNFRSYEREVLAYKQLESVWGKLVPKPELISASPSGNVRYLGMTLGTSPEGGVGEDEFLEKIYELETRFKFRHLDVFSGGCNYILVPGTEKVLVIDMEAWEEIK